jgi:hypothetical protein
MRTLIAGNQLLLSFLSIGGQARWIRRVEGGTETKRLNDHRKIFCTESSSLKPSLNPMLGLIHK